MEPNNWKYKPPWHGHKFNKGKLVLKRHRPVQQKSKDRERNTKLLQKWLSDDHDFVEVSTFQSIVKKVRENQICIIIGSCNSGKTTTMRHIAILLQNDFEVISVSDPRDVINFGNHDDIQLFTLDDFFNKLTVERTNMERLDYLERSIFYALGEKSKLIMTCDIDTYQFMKLNGFVFCPEYVVDLDSEEYRMNLDERQHILARHLKNQTKSRAIAENLSLIRDIEEYPVLCNLFSKIDEVKDFHSLFFTRWRECISYILDKMKEDLSLQYAVLVLCVLCSSLMPEKLEEVVNEKYQVFLDCKVNHKVHYREVGKTLSELQGKFVMINDKSAYVVIHTTLAEEIVLHYGRDFPSTILSNMSYCFLQRCLQRKTHDTKHELTLANCISNIDIKSSTTVCHRLFSSIEKGDLHSVYKSKLLCNKTISKRFVQLLQKKPFEKITHMFLSPQPCLTNVASHVIQDYEPGHHSKNPYQKIFQSTSRDITEDMLLADQTKGYDKWTHNVRGISWVIYYGQDELLKSILKIANENGMDARAVLFMGTTTTESEKEASRLLVLACYGGNEDTVKILVSHFKAIDINKHSKQPCTSDDYHADTPLTAACRRGHFPVVKLLLKAGANVNQVNAFNESPLCAALESKNIILIKFLLERKASQSWSTLRPTKEPIDITFLNELRNEKQDVDTLLQMASKSGNVGTVKYLLDGLTDSDKHYEYKTSSLLLAIKHGQRKIVQILIEAGAGSKCNSALNAAIEEGNNDIALDLIKHYKVCKRMKSDLSPLVQAAKSGNVTIFKELFINCSKVECSYIAEKVPLQGVILRGHVDVALMLIKHGAYASKENAREFNPLYIASEKGYSSIVFALIHSGAKPNERLKRGNKAFPLYIAAKNGHTNVVKVLLKAGANMEMKTNEGFTALKIAILENKPDVSRCLVDAENLKENLRGNYHLFETLQSFRRAQFHLNEFDNIVPKRKINFLVQNNGDMMENIICKDYIHLRHMIDLGLDPNDNLAIYEDSSRNTYKKSLLSLFIDKWLKSTQRIKKIELLAQRGAKFNFQDLRQMPSCECDSSFLDVMNEIRCHIRRNSF